MSDRLEFSVESLESRQLLAGNVTVEVTSARDLVINGDDFANSVQVDVQMYLDMLVVHSLDGTTLVNGQVPPEDGLIIDFGPEPLRDLRAVSYTHLTLPTICSV